MGFVMKIFIVVLLVLGLTMDVCFGRSMISSPIEKRFDEATYAFKFRVTSKVMLECFPGPDPGTTQGTTKTPTTTIAPTTYTTRATTTSSVSTSTDRFTTVPTEASRTTSDAPSANTANETSTHRRATILTQSTTKATTTPAITMKSSDETLTEKAGKSIATSSGQMQSTSQETTVSSIDQQKTNFLNQKLYFMSSTTRPTKLSSPDKLLERELVGSEATDNFVNTTESPTSGGRVKRSCEILVGHQDIKIRKIFKGCDGVDKMKRVQRMNKKYLKSSIRLQMEFSLQPNKNYLFMGRAVPNQQPSDYVFLAGQLTVVAWKPDAMALKKYFKSKGRRRC